MLNEIIKNEPQNYESNLHNDYSIPSSSSNYNDTDSNLQFGILC